MLVIINLLTSGQAEKIVSSLIDEGLTVRAIFDGGLLPYKNTDCPITPMAMEVSESNIHFNELCNKASTALKNAGIKHCGIIMTGDGLATMFAGNISMSQHKKERQEKLKKHNHLYLVKKPNLTQDTPPDEAS